MHYVTLRTPKSVDSKAVEKEITKLIKSGVKTNEIAWKMEGVTTDLIAREMTAKFQKIKNRIAFQIRG